MSENTLASLTKMREPFKPEQINQMCRSTKKDNPKGKCTKCGGLHGLPAVQLVYVGHAMITHRLLEADPSWTWEPLAVDQTGYPVTDKDGGMWIKLTIGGVTRLGYGDAQGKTGGDAMKERIGDAIRNAAMRFGAALDLWHKGDLYAGDEAEKKEVILITERQLFDLLALIADVKADEKKFCVYYKIADVAELPESKYNSAVKSLEAKRTS
jgi:hypothetical protein